MHYFKFTNMLHSASNPFTITLIVLFSMYFIQIICLTNHALEIVPERVEITYGNEKYAKDIKVNVRRYGRRSPYVSHFEAVILQEFGNNITVGAILYEYLHNEYKRSFVEFHFKLCDFINKDDFIGYHVRKVGIPCPMSRGHWNLSNVILNFPYFPYVFPFKRAKAVVTVEVTATGELIATGNFYVSIKQK